MRRTRLLSAAALLLIGSSAFAQAKPNFNGKWVILPDSVASAQQQGMPRGGAAMGGLSEEATIAQDDKTLSIARELTVGPVKSVFNLDGSETRQSLDIGNGNIVDLTLKAQWEGTKLLTSTWVNLQGQSFEIVLNLSLDDKGNLISEHITPAMGNNPGGTEIAKYKKQ
jgi:hypothetical protein